MNLSDLPLYQINEENKVGERIYKTQIGGLYYVSTEVLNDDRGFYREIAVIPDLNNITKSSFEIKQLNHSDSVQNVVRGIHAENWNKLITVTHGVCLCVLCDIRPDSPTFLQKEYFLLGYGQKSPLPGSIFVTNGIGNSFLTVEGPSEYIYAVDQLYRNRDTGNDIAISLFDEDLKINWPIGRENMIISERDLNFTTLRAKYPEKFSK